jgi:phage gp36-like protein
VLLDDFDSSIHNDILMAVVKQKQHVVAECSQVAVEEMSGYLSNRFDVVSIFEKQGKDRNNYLLMLAKDIALYHICCIHNPQKLTEVRRMRYEDAITTLVKIQSGKYAPVGLPVLQVESNNAEGGYLFSSNTKRDNHL